ncbi:hypothetical protein MZ018_14215 [Shewanella sp. JNE10-2]|uniref:hypothetical protein n=1 Tax=unclassified Shewanella TaxID=196818 RepID=UPI00200562D4|nr:MULTISPECIES: hypothetical protein [unclassified Shewanella]MCK7628736.1 hypothetical protein [Shewanella sp. JNE9-1]MCK7643985.1 hypothetical protein [Shewanella sp. JNE3-1]MCK7652039.1 hypothetical protein [Shewanella sp. JNE4-1]UPO26065.1 hypothetical protein MZ018_14215 [Shewanella sp. JNE10-2]UPO37051.1 hypothetical protein MZ097_09155 [Shewanella sp. JNE7]
MSGLKCKTVGMVLLSLVLLSACDMQKKLTPEEQQQVSGLKQELQKVDTEIGIETTELAQYSGGLIKNIKQVRLETLKLTRDIVNQRIQAIESGAKITITVPVTQPSIERATALLSEIDQAKAQLAVAKENASRYSGGLVAALSLSTVATQEQTLAMLEQQYLVAKYGLSFAPFTPAENIAKGASSTSLSASVAGSYGADSSGANSSGAVASPLPDTAQANAQIPEVQSSHEQAMLVADGPFGLAMGMTKEMFNGRLTQAKTGLYFLDKPPIPHDQFESYVVKIGEKSGLCWIKGIGKNVASNGYGMQLKGAFDEFETKLDKRYGVHERTDFLMPASIWKDPQDWMMGLLKADRYLLSVWKGDKKPLPNDLSSIGLLAQAESSSSGYLALEYSFSNKEACDTEIKQVDDSGL